MPSPRPLFVVLLVLFLGVPALAFGAAESQEAAFKRFALAIQESIGEGDPSLLDGSFDADLLLERAVGSYPLEPKHKESFGTALRKRGGFGLGGSIVRAIEEEGSYTFLRLVRVGGEDRALFRLISESGLNYHGLTLRLVDGQVRIVDFLHYMNSELLSETLGRAYLEAVAAEEKGLLARLVSKDGEWIRNLPKIQKMRQLGEQEEKYAEALKVYRSLPASLQKDKNLLLLRLKYASAADEKEYVKGMKLFRDTYPADPAVDLVTLDMLLLNEQYHEALQALGRIGTLVGGDPYLGVLRANILLETGDTAAAKESARRAVAEEKTLEDGYWVLITIALLEKDHRETARLLTALEKDLDIGLSDLQDAEVFADFTQSAEYRQWMKSRRK